MNFVVIMNDTLRPDHIGPYGNTWVRTPSADKFAQSAAIFEKAYVGSFPTIPNRTDLFTGRWGEPFHPWLPLKYGEPTLPSILAEHGYVTQLICDTPHLIQGGHNFDFPFHAWQFIRGQEVDRYGMDHDPVEMTFKDASKVDTRISNHTTAQYMRNIRGRVAEEDWATSKTYQAAVNWLERNHKHEKFFLWIDGFDPHEPPSPPQHYLDMYDPGYQGDVFYKHIRTNLLTEAEIRHIKARYAASVTFVDRQVGRVLQALDDLGLSENTCVFWMSDHGTHLGEHGNILGKYVAYNEIARIVWMVRHPQRLGAGRRFGQIVQPVDLAPTALELAGIDVPQRMQGLSHAPLLSGGRAASRPAAFSANTRVGPWTPKLVLRACDGRWALQDFGDPSLRKLFDLDNDPIEQRDVSAEFPQHVERLHGEVLRFLRECGTQEAMVRFFETGNPTALENWKSVRPGFEDFQQYFGYHLYNSKVFPD